MKTLIGSWVLLALAGALQAKDPELKLKIQVFVYNYAGVSSETLAQAGREAARIYDRTGIQTEWLDCPLTPDEAAQYPACQLPLSPTRLAIRVLSRNMAKRMGLSRTTIGSALFPEYGGYGIVAHVCAYCAEDLAERHTAAYGVILGYVMAHELGHLLLGVGSHAPTGLMHVPWNKKELDSIAKGWLLFTSREGDTMRRQVSARFRDVLLADASRN